MTFKESYRHSIAMEVIKAGPSETALYKRCSDILNDLLNVLEAEIEAERAFDEA